MENLIPRATRSGLAPAKKRAKVFRNKGRAALALRNPLCVPAMETIRKFKANDFATTTLERSPLGRLLLEQRNSPKAEGLRKVLKTKQPKVGDEKSRVV